MYQPPVASSSAVESAPIGASAAGVAALGGAWPARRVLSASLLLACRHRRHDEAGLIAAALTHELGDERAVRVLMAVGALLGGDASVGQAALASEQHSGEADAGTLIYAMVDRLAGGDQGWRPLVDRVLSTSSDPTWRAIAYAIAQQD